MALNVTVAELYRAAPVLSRIARAKLSVLGAMKLNQLMSLIDKQIEKLETERMAKIKELAILNEDGSIAQHDEVNEQGKTVAMPNYKSVEAEQEMQAFGEVALQRVVRVPFRIKSKHLIPPFGGTSGGYALSVEECKNLGRFLSYDDVPAEPDEDIEEGDK